MQCFGKTARMAVKCVDDGSKAQNGCKPGCKPGWSLGLREKGVVSCKPAHRKEEFTEVLMFWSGNDL